MTILIIILAVLAILALIVWGIIKAVEWAERQTGDW